MQKSAVGTWGVNLWTLASLSLNEKVDLANARLLKRAHEYIKTYRANGSLPSPTLEKQDNIRLSPYSVNNRSQGVAFVHNLFAGVFRIVGHNVWRARPQRRSW